MKKPFILGIAGYIGSGKSTVANYFASKGAMLIDADKIVDDLYQPDHDGYLKIVNFFGPEYMTKNGLINRKKLAKFVFKDPKKLQILNYLIHPLVTNEVQKIIDKAKDHFIVLEAIVFDPKALGKFIDAFLWVDCDRELLLKRALGHPGTGMTATLFAQILRTQHKPQRIDYVVENNTTLEDLYRKLDELHFPIAT